MTTDFFLASFLLVASLEIQRCDRTAVHWKKLWLDSDIFSQDYNRQLIGSPTVLQHGYSTFDQELIMTEQDKKEEVPVTTGTKHELEPEHKEVSGETPAVSEPETKKTKVEKTENKKTELPESSDPSEILKQVEFYFSDANLPNDKFLWTTTQKNEGGWIPIATICAFKRMSRFSKVSPEDIAAALKQSKDLLEVSEDNLKVRRQKPLVEPKKEEKQEQFARSIYAKGFGEETSTSQFDIEKFFEQYGEVKQVRLRRNDDKQFKGSVFVEFAKLEDAQKFVNVDPKPKFNENELVTMSKQAYVDMKQAEHGFAASANGRKPRKFNAFRDKAKKN